MEAEAMMTEQAEKTETARKLSPVFIVGAARSGTTLLQQMLDHHPNLAIPWESHFMVEFYRKLERFGDLHQVENRARLILAIERYVQMVWREWVKEKWIPGLTEAAPQIAAEAEPSYAGVVDAIYSFFLKQRGRKRWGDKTPGYVDTMRELLDIFPEARFIHLIRDGRDVASSIMPLSFGPNSIYLAAVKWQKCVRHGRNFVRDHPDKGINLRYEDLIDDPEKHLRHLCEFIGEPFAPEMLDFHRDGMGRVPRQVIHTQIAKPVNKQSSGRWKKDLSPGQIRVFEAVAGKMLAECGYELSRPDAKLRWYDKPLGKIAHRVRVLRTGTKPTGLAPRMLMYWNRITFRWE